LLVVHAGFGGFVETNAWRDPVDCGLLLSRAPLGNHASDSLVLVLVAELVLLLEVSHASKHWRGHMQ
jgi:hypothetical protein